MEREGFLSTPLLLIQAWHRWPERSRKFASVHSPRRLLWSYSWNQVLQLIYGNHPVVLSGILASYLYCLNSTQDLTRPYEQWVARGVPCQFSSSDITMPLRSPVFRFVPHSITVRYQYVSLINRTEDQAFRSKRTLDGVLLKVPKSHSIYSLDLGCMIMAFNFRERNANLWLA